MQRNASTLKKPQEHQNASSTDLHHVAETLENTESSGNVGRNPRIQTSLCKYTAIAEIEAKDIARKVCLNTGSRELPVADERNYTSGG